MGIALSEDGQEQAGMGVGVGDYDLDGELDICKDALSRETCLRYITTKAKATSRTSRFAPDWVSKLDTSAGAPDSCDLDNDGYPDIFMVTGSVYPGSGKEVPQYPYGDAARCSSATSAMGSSKKFQTWPDRASPRAIAAADALSAISITMATWIS